MIKDFCFTEEWLDQFKKKPDHRRILDDAVSASARIAYLAARLMLNDLSPFAFYTGQDMKEWNIDNTEYNLLNRLKKLPDKSSFYYWYLTVMLLP